MPKKIIRTTLTLVIEEIEMPSSMFPAAMPYVETDGDDVSEQSQFRPLAKCPAPSTMALSMGRRR